MYWTVISIPFSIVILFVAWNSLVSSSHRDRKKSSNVDPDEPNTKAGKTAPFGSHKNDTDIYTNADKPLSFHSRKSLSDKEQWVTSASAIFSNHKHHSRLQTDSANTEKPGDTLLQMYATLQAAMGEKIFTQEELNDAFAKSQGSDKYEPEAYFQSISAKNCIGRLAYVRDNGPPLGTVYTKSVLPTAEDCQGMGDPDAFDMNTAKNGFLFPYIQSDWDQNWEPSDDPKEYCKENPALKGKGLKLYINKLEFRTLIPTSFSVGESYNCLGATAERDKKAPCDDEKGEKITAEMVLVRGTQERSWFMSQPKSVWAEKYVECANPDVKKELEATLNHAHQTWSMQDPSHSAAPAVQDGPSHFAKVNEAKSDAHSMAMTSLVNAMIALLVTSDL